MMMKKLKRSTVDLIRAVLFALCALTWLPNWPVERVNWPRITMSVLCAAVSGLFLVQYFKSRKAECEAK